MLYVLIFGGCKMVYGILCYCAIGILIAIIFSLLFVTFDKSAMRILSSLVSFTGTTSLGIVIENFFGISERDMKLICMFSLYVSFIISFLISMYIMCKIIKDKDNADALRIRDIILGQKSYVNKYYEKRCKEIDEELNIEALEQREAELNRRENAIKDKETYIEQELEKLNQLGNKKLRLQLPEKTNIIISNSFLKTMPSYIRDLSKCIGDIEKFTEQFIDENEKKDVNLIQITSYLMSICVSISEYIFGGGSQDVRIHFRKYDAKTGLYEKLIATIGNKVTPPSRKMTSIPYSGSMIERSDICKRALIKSINSDYDFTSNNSTIWKDYMTFSFYGIRQDGFPILSFGISVKNEERFKQVFYFLNYFRIEECLEENLEKIDDIFDIKSIFYGEEGAENV